MKITIDTDILKKYNITFGEYLVLLLGYYDFNFDDFMGRLVDKHLADISYDVMDDIILSDNTKNLVSRILVESSEKLRQSPVKDFDALAEKLMSIYPEGNKGGTTYPWRGTKEEIAQKLRVLVVKYDFIYTEQEAINATKAYVYSFQDKGDYTHMKLLKYFLLRTKNGEITSNFMSIIENNKDENNNR